MPNDSPSPAAGSNDRERQRYYDEIRKAEQFAQAYPDRHRRRVLLIAVMGYLLLVAPLLIGLVTTAVLGWFFWGAHLRDEDYAGTLFGVTIVAGFFTLSWVGALWVRVPAPVGIRVLRKDAPDLFTMIDRVRAHGQLPKLTQVLLTLDATAGLASRPMFLGWFGPSRHVLLLGVQLLASLSSEQVQSVLAHEFSHLRRGDNRSTTWGFRVRTAWMRLATSGNNALSPLIKIIGPKLDAWTFASARAAEYDADRFAAELTDARTVGDALLRTTLVTEYIENQYMPTFFDAAGRDEAPPKDFQRALLGHLRGGGADEPGRRELERALRDQTSFEDSHPSLCDRLRRVGYDQVVGIADPLDWPVPPQPVHDALRVLFDASFVERSLELFDADFHLMLAEAWAVRRKDIEASAADLAGKSDSLLPLVDLSEVPTNRDMDALIHTGSIVMDAQGVDASMPWFHRVLQLDAEHPIANAMVGQELMKQEDQAGLVHARRAIELDPRMVVNLGEPMYLYLRGQGRVQEAEAFQAQVQDMIELLQKAEIERVSVASGKKLERHDFSEYEVLRLHEDLDRCPELECAYLYRQKIKHLAKVPAYALAVKFKLPWHRLVTEGRERRLAEQVMAGLRTDRWVTVYTYNYATWAKSMSRKHPDAEVYRRG